MYNQWFHSGTGPNLVLAPMSSEGLVTVDAGGVVRLWETAMCRLNSAVSQWKSLIGQGQGKNLQVNNFHRHIEDCIEIL